MKKLFFVLLAVAAIGGTATGAQALPCWNGIKSKCTVAPESWSEYQTRKLLEFLE